MILMRGRFLSTRTADVDRDMASIATWDFGARMAGRTPVVRVSGDPGRYKPFGGLISQMIPKLTVSGSRNVLEGWP